MPRPRPWMARLVRSLLRRKRKWVSNVCAEQFTHAPLSVQARLHADLYHVRLQDHPTAPAI